MMTKDAKIFNQKRENENTWNIGTPCVVWNDQIWNANESIN